MDTNDRECLKYKKRIVIKIGSSSLIHKYTGMLDLGKVEKLVRTITDLHNQGMEVILVSSGAIAVGRKTMGYIGRPSSTSEKQALASIGQARLMTTYQKIFAEYNQVAAQILITKNTMLNEAFRSNARNTFDELLKMGAIPIVNENDTVAIDELPGENFGDNDMLSAMVASMIHADRLIILSDIDGLYDKNPKEFPDARLITSIPKIDDTIFEMAADGAGSNRGTGGMKTKLSAALHATEAGITCSIINGSRPENLYDLIENNAVGTTFAPQK